MRPDPPLAVPEAVIGGHLDHLSRVHLEAQQRCVALEKWNARRHEAARGLDHYFIAGLGQFLDGPAVAI